MELRATIMATNMGVTAKNRFSDLFTKRSLTSTTAILAYLALADFVFHMSFAGNEGYFRDELYYIVSGTQHLSLGYVDFPPMIAYVAALLNVFTKDSLVSIHVVPAFNEALLVFVTGIIARELGGGRRAQVLAAISTFMTLDLLAFGSLFSPDSFDSLWWSLLAYLIIRIVRRKEPKLWIVAGLVVGMGLFTKLTIFFFVAALFISFLAIPSGRKYLRSKWIPVGGLLAIIFILPMTYWNFIHGWPMIQFYLSFRGDVSAGGPLDFFINQLAGISILNFPILLIGLFYFLRSDDGRQLRALGLTYIILFVFMALLDMKPYYLMPVYPMLYAGGAILIEKSSVSRIGKFRWFGSKPFIACLIIVALLLAPIAMPILAPSTLLSKYGASAYQSSPLPDKYGWSLMVKNLSQAYNTLPASEKSQACFFTSNYGEASAINFLGRGLGLPEAISGHNNYYIWGPGSCTGHVLITVGLSLTEAQVADANATLLTTISCPLCISYEQNLPVYLVVNQSFSIASVWSQVRQYD